jgi:hypothetical protein
MIPKIRVKISPTPSPTASATLEFSKNSLKVLSLISIISEVIKELFF